MNDEDREHWDRQRKHWPELQVERMVAQGWNWYEAERTVRIEAVEAKLDGEPPWWNDWSNPGAMHKFTEHLWRPSYYGA
jgi:hypothetical protein